MKLKHLLAVLLFTVTTVLQAQIKFESYNLNEARQLADSIALNAKYPFVFVEEGIAKANHNQYFRYVNKENEEERLTVFFNIRMEGRNVDLEIEGTPKYEFNAVYGRFVNLFPFWKKFIDPTADAEKITTGSRYHNVNKDSRKFTLQRQSDKWGITMF